ncbi:MAG: bifunctional glutamate N-acetyltransferase/amino-acid acetyltransferase ArgJ, partial [Actinomycetota bacterium]|nr:bifunctional glutamate N-acetyltransferase/amino-acid acetyltransferase ArgJ [Actinomycetota bacterium]
MSVTAARGFEAAGVACGIKDDGRADLALVATADRRAVPAAGVFTANLATAAPVLVSRSHLDATAGQAAAVVLNSANANAATGDAGRADAEQTCALVADRLGCRGEEVLVCSTGLIGIPLPMTAIRAGVPSVTGALCPAGAADAAGAILTTDTAAKEVAVGGPGFTVGGMAKGAAMLAPDMATMLALLTTDAAASPAELGAALHAGVADSFNTLSVDGCCSTNDTVLLLGSGLAGPVDHDRLTAAVVEACADLAGQMAADAEGATKVVRVVVTGAASTDDARRVARRIADSQLCKCSWYGADPYWGRVVSEAGSAGAAFDPGRVSVAYGGVTVCVDGVAAAHDDTALMEVMAGRHLQVGVHLGLGEGAASILTSDLTHGYIDENMR